MTTPWKAVEKRYLFKDGRLKAESPFPDEDEDEPEDGTYIGVSAIFAERPLDLANELRTHLGTLEPAATSDPPAACDEPPPFRHRREPSSQIGQQPGADEPIPEGMVTQGHLRKHRGWNPALIWRFLPEPDERRKGPKGGYLMRL